MKKRTSKDIFAETLLELADRLPMNKITVKMIVEESGLSLQTFYNHFTDKAELILYVHKSAFDKIMDKIGKNGFTPRDATLENIRFYYAHRDFMRNALSNTEGQQSYLKASIDNAYQTLRLFMMKKSGETELSSRVVFSLKMFCTASAYAYMEWAFYMKDISPETFEMYMADIVPEPLKPYFAD